jgi:hypothetical protein
MNSKCRLIAIGTKGPWDCGIAIRMRFGMGGSVVEKRSPAEAKSKRALEPVGPVRARCTTDDRKGRYARHGHLYSSPHHALDQTFLQDTCPSRSDSPSRRRRLAKSLQPPHDKEASHWSSEECL